MIKGIHFSDTHIGANPIGPLDPETRLSGRILDQLDILDSIVDFAEEEGIDIALFTGDAFHTSTPSQVLINEFSRRIARLKDICPVVLLVGNHDVARLDRPSAMQIYDTLKLDNVYVGYDYRRYVIPTAHGDVQVTTVPYPTRHILNDKELKSQDVRTALNKHVHKLIRELAYDVDAFMPAYMVGHFTVGNVNIQYGAEKEFNAGDEGDVELADIVDVWDYVALGHIHKHQEIAHNVVYAGATERVSFGEEFEDKGFVYFVTDEDSEQRYVTTWEFVATDARPYRSILIDCTEAKHPTARALKHIESEDLKDAIVRVKIVIQQSRRSMVDLNAIDYALRQSGMYTVSGIIIESAPDVEDVRMNTDRFNVSMTPSKLMAAYVDHTNGTAKKDERKALLDLARDIMKEVNNDRK